MAIPFRSPLTSVDSSAIRALRQEILSPVPTLLSGTQVVLKLADYIGSFLVAGRGHHERADIVRQKLDAAKTYTHSKPIRLLISLHGIKVCNDVTDHVYMAHALRRISYATCDPDNHQFAFLAREPKAQPNLQYCHAFVTSTAEEAEELNNIVGEAFRLAYTQQRMTVFAQTACSPCNQPVPVTTAHSDMCTRPAPAGQEVDIYSKPPSTAHDRPPHSHSSPIRSTAQLPNLTIQPSDINRPLHCLPTSSPVPNTSGQSVHFEANERRSSAVETHREHKSHKHHHKHHKHRHHHKIRETSTAITSTGTVCSADSDRRTGTGESSNDVPVESPEVSDQNSIQTKNETFFPVPPPRGSSSFGACNVEVQPFNGNPPPVKRLSSALLRPTSDVLNSLETLSLSVIEPSKDRSNGSLEVIRRTVSEVTRPVSQHSYDIAEHHSCLALPDALGATSVTTTTGSVTGGGCSTSTSSSVGSRGSFQGPSRSSATRVSGGSGGSNGNRPNSMLPHLPHSFQQPGSRRFSEDLHDPGSASQTVLAAPSSVDVELAHATWYQPHVPRKVALEILSRQPPGSFVIRDSGSHANCYALSVRYGEGAGRCSVHHHLPQSPSSVGNSGPSGQSSYPVSPPTGISHFLIQRDSNGSVKLKGLEKEWPSLACLVLHLTVMPEMLPCPLRLPRETSNLTFSPTDLHNQHRPHLEQTPGLSSGAHFRPISGPLENGKHPRSLTDASGFVDNDEEYQRLSDFSSIMADLKLRPRATNHIPHANVKRSGVSGHINQ